jgi:hypothetical protein
MPMIQVMIQVSLQRAHADRLAGGRMPDAGGRMRSSAAVVEGFPA